MLGKWNWIGGKYKLYVDINEFWGLKTIKKYLASEKQQGDKFTVNN